MTRRKSRIQRKSQQTKIPNVDTEASTRTDPITGTTAPRVEDNSFFNVDMVVNDSSEEEDSSGINEPNEETMDKKLSPKVSDNEEARTRISKNIKYIMDKDLEDFLRDCFGVRDEDKDNEILQSLHYDGITSWVRFRRLHPDMVESLTKNANRSRVQISKSARMELCVMIQFIRERIDTGYPEAKDIRTYDAEEFEEYLDQHYRTKQLNAVTQGISVPNNYTGGYKSKSKTEKALDNWEKKKHDKSNYEILRDDSKYKIWKETFVAEIKVQGLSRMISPTFNKQQLQDQFDRELYEKQSDYLWTVLLYALKNPIAEVILGKHRDNSDARTAFLALDNQMQGNVAQMYSVSDLSDTLRDLHISKYNGSRVQFVADWFELLRRLNKVADKEDRLSYVHVRSQLMRAINTDRDLTNSFTELKDEPDRDLATSKLMSHILEKAMLYDGRDHTATSKDTKNMNAMLHKIGIEDDDIIRINQRRVTPEDCKLPDIIYSKFTREDKIQWHSISDDAKRIILSHLPTSTGGQQVIRHKGERHVAKRKAYMHAQGAHDTSSHGEDVDSNTARTVAVHTIHALRHSLRNAEEQLQLLDSQASMNDHDTYTAMSSVTSGSRPPPSNSDTTTNPNTNTPNNKKEEQEIVGRTHPGRIMANKNEFEDKRRKELSVNFHGGYKTFQHHILYDVSERDKDKSTSQEYSDITYTVSKRKIGPKTSTALADRGANGCVGGDDCVWLGATDLQRYVHITGMDDHQVRDVPVGTIGALAYSNRGPVICIFNQSAYTGRGHSILSSIQMEHFRNRVDDRVQALGGGQQITTSDGYNFPLSITNGLAYLNLRKFTKIEYQTLPHVVMTSEQPWDPRLYDDYIDPKSNKYLQANPENLHLLPYDEYDVKGEYIDVNASVSYAPTELEFWLHERDYEHAETIHRCAHSARIKTTYPHVLTNACL